MYAGFVSAHATGRSYEEVKDGFKVDIGYPDVASAGDSSWLDFSIAPVAPNEKKDDIYTDVWVIVKQDKRLLFAGDVHKPVFGQTGFTYLFPDAGVYTISARFQKDSEAVVQLEFPLEVAASSETKKGTSGRVTDMLFAVMGMVFGGIVALLVARKKGHKIEGHRNS